MAVAPNRPPPADLPHHATGGAYSIHPLAALDGVLLYVTLNGEAVGSWFGATEQLAAEAFAQHLTGAVTAPSGGTSTSEHRRSTLRSRGSSAPDARLRSATKSCGTIATCAR